MKYFKYCLYSFLFFSLNTQATNFALIHDKDGMVNVRDTASLNSKIVTKMKNDELVRCVSDDGTPNFCFINSSKGEDGYIYKDRLNFFKNFSKAKLFNYSSNKVTYKYKNIIVEIKAKLPNFKHDSLVKKNDKNGGVRYYLNNKEIFGTDGIVPNQRFLQLENIIINDGVHKILIGNKELEQFFLPLDGLGGENEMADFEVYILGDKIYVVSTLNNGGAAEYNLAFIFKSGKLENKFAWKLVF